MIMDANPPPPMDTSQETPLPEAPKPKEIGGFDGPEPTRHGDWTIRGRCSDF